MKTLQQLAQEAIDVQDACNLSGVVHSFSRLMTDLRALFPDEGTDFFNHHPIVVLFADKIADLSASEVSALKAYRYVAQLAAGETIDYRGEE